jgi:hypothetical protein
MISGFIRCALWVSKPPRKESEESAAIDHSHHGMTRVQPKSVQTAATTLMNECSCHLCVTTAACCGLIGPAVVVLIGADQ